MSAAIHPALAASVSVLLAVAVIGDLRERRIPNWLSLGGIVMGVALHTALRGGDGASTALLGGLAGGLLLFPFYLLRGMAAGDVKLMAAVGAHLGPSLTLVAALATLIAGAALAVFTLYRGRTTRLANPITNPDSPTGARTLAYAPAIAVGSVVAGTLPLWLAAVPG